ncbi:MAG: DMT family transporter [Pirellulaceae bacterium]|jgi:drug/metabolite transporter (DMT)-like permease|nr:DMT family transporter [Pirellulaceae bacterium]
MFPPAALPYVWMLLGASSFAGMALLTAGLRDKCDWQWIAIFRTGLAMLLAAALARGGGAKLVFFRPAKLWMRSLAGSISLLCGFYAMTHYPVSEVLTLTNMFPLWVALLSWPLLGESPPLDVWPAVVVGLVGVSLIQQPASGSLWAVGVALLSSLTSAVALIGLHQVKEIDPRAIVVHFSAVALAFCVGALFLLPGQHGLATDPQTLASLVGVGVFATVGQLFLTKAFAAGPPARVSVVGLAQVGITMILEMVLWHRTFSALTLVGIALVVSPTIWTLLKVRSKPRVVAASPPAEKPAAS